ncbi:glutathione S-transferase C-terminal-like protein [Lenzites betulinus]|nr:glutathione S-transferase C-terminal-like protein [Lenzites betulinus]
MSQEHHFTLYTHAGGPNGWKVAIVLEELGLDYHPIYLEFEKGEHKAPEYVKYNPNGRIPALIDHKNNDFVIWESCAIISYLVEKYDTEGKVSVKSFEENALQLQWLFFQASGQGPYFGQIGWFLFFHPERLPSAVERYRNEARRVLGVLESVLSKQEWLVGDKCTVADLSFITWNMPIVKFSGGLPGFEAFDFQKEFPSVYKWHNTALSRPAVSKVFATKEELTAKA